MNLFSQVWTREAIGYRQGELEGGAVRLLRHARRRTAIVSQTGAVLRRSNLNSFLNPGRAQFDPPEMLTSDLAPLMPVVPEREPIAPWVEMAVTLRRLHEDLAGEGLGPRDVIEHAAVETADQSSAPGSRKSFTSSQWINASNHRLLVRSGFPSPKPCPPFW